MKNLKKVKVQGNKTLRTRSSYVAKKKLFTSNKRAATSSEKYDAVCSECRKACEVPFRPNGKKPVYCSDCFKGKEDTSSAHTSARPAYFKGGDSEKDDTKKQFAILNAKIDRLLKIIETKRF